MKYFNELALKASKKFMDRESWKDVVNEIAEASDKDTKETIYRLDMEIQEHISGCIASAIPTALHLGFKDNGLSEKEELTIGCFTYGAEFRRAGSNASVLTPTFDCRDADGNLWPVSIFTEKPHKADDDTLIDMFTKPLYSHPSIMGTMEEYLNWAIYDPAAEEWVENDPMFEGLTFSIEDVRRMLAIHVITIIHLLLDKDLGLKGQLELAEGIYTLIKVHDDETFEIGFQPSRHYKMLIKNDELTENVDV